MSKLHNILEDQLAAAQAHAGTKIVRTLSRGLRVEITCVSNDVRLTLSRDDDFPSIEEWDTITAFFPYQVPKVFPLPKIDDHGRYTLSERFASERTMQMKYF